jgi:AcrR family transcriptional regulator
MARVSSPSPPRRQRADAQRNHERLLAAAEPALNAEGVNASLDDIAKAAGVGNATLYRHFPTRERLIEEVYDRRITALCDDAHRLAGGTEPGEALVEWMHAVVVHINRSRVLADAFTAAYLGPRDVEPPQVVAWHRAVRRAAAPLLRAAQTAGAVRTDLSSAELVALTTAVAQAGSPTQTRRLLRLLLEGLAPQQPRTVSSSGSTPRVIKRRRPGRRTE